MKNENNFVIQKTDKGNTIVILDRDFYLKSIETLLKDFSKFKSISVALDKDFNYVNISKERVSDLLKKLKNKNAIREETHNKLRSVGSKPRALYRPTKVHKPLKKKIFSDWHPYIQIGNIFRSPSV